MLQSIHEHVIIEHGFIISLFLLLDLLHEQVLLDEWVVQLCVGITEFVVVDEQLESLSESYFRSVVFGQGGHQLRVLHDECWVQALGFKEMANELVDKTNSSPRIRACHMVLFALVIIKYLCLFGGNIFW